MLTDGDGITKSMPYTKFRGSVLVMRGDVTRK